MPSSEGILLLNKEALQCFTGPCVYVFWSRQGCLYVGMSASGLCRPLNQAHPVLRQSKTDADFDRVEIHWCNTRENALELEQVFIDALSPRLNNKAFLRKSAKGRLKEAKESKKERLRKEAQERAKKREELRVRILARKEDLILEPKIPKAVKKAAWVLGVDEKEFFKTLGKAS